MHVDNALQRDSKLVLRAEKLHDLLEDFGIGSRRIVKTGCVHERDFLPSNSSAHHLTLGGLCKV